MWTENDEARLLIKYPGLLISAISITGSLGFSAGYNERTGFIIGNRSNDEVGNLCLSGRFEIRIEKRGAGSIFRLPSLFVDEIKHTPERHFNQNDQSACLCSPLEEDDFLNPRFEIVRYIEELVIPFLYGQLFYDSAGRWPWSEYSHGALGLLEAYSKNPTSTKALECLSKLLSQFSDWSRIKPILEQKGDVKGHIPCLCAKADHMRRCHQDALKGLRFLKGAIKKYNLILPK